MCEGTPSATSVTTLPYAVDNDYYAAGYEGDVASISNNGDTTGTACGALSPAAPRAANAKCWKVVYTPPAADSGVVGAGFAAVEWQSNLVNMGSYANNFGIAAGKIPPAGATEASFWAKGALGGEVVIFSVGTPNFLCADSVIAPGVQITLTTTWTKYSIPFTAPVSYTAGQVDAFTWDTAAGMTPTTFYFDNVEWDANSPADAGSE
jgi:hypothetical protein